MGLSPSHLSFRCLRPPWKMVSEGSRPAVENRIVPDEPTALVRAAAMCGCTQ